VKEQKDKLKKETRERRKLERKLAIAEDSVKRLDDALRRNGIKLDIDVFADVKTLLKFFEERVDAVKRDAQRIDIMKKALKAKSRYIMGVGAMEGGGGEGGAGAGAAAGGGNADSDDDDEGEEDDEWEEEDVAAPAPVVAAGTEGVLPSSGAGGGGGVGVEAEEELVSEDEEAGAEDDEWSDSD